MSSSTSEGFLSVEDVIDLNHDYYSTHDLHSIDDDELKLFHRDLVTPAPSVYNGEDDIIHRHMFRQRPISRGGESVMLFKKINNGDEDVSFDLVSSELRDFIDTDSMSDDTFLYREPTKKITPVILNYQQKKSLVPKEIQEQKSRQIVPELHRIPTARIRQKSVDPELETPRVKYSTRQYTSREAPKIRQPDTIQERLSVRQNDVHGNVVKLAPSRKYENLTKQIDKPLRPFDTSRQQRYENTTRQYDTPKQYDTRDTSRQYETREASFQNEYLTRQRYSVSDSKPILSRRYGVVDNLAMQYDNHRQIDASNYKPSRQHSSLAESDHTTSRQYDKPLRTLDSSRYRQYEPPIQRPSRQYDSFEKSLSSPRLRSMKPTTDEVTDSAKQLLASIRERRKSTMEQEARQRYNSLAFDFQSKVSLRDGLRRSSTSRFELPARTTTRLPQRSLYH